jgi:anti-sigma regulatory factor (Ser/Thr protein kinase)
MDNYTTKGAIVTPKATIHVTYSASVLTSAAIRKRVKELLDEQEVAFTIETEQFIQAIGEAATNAYRHGCLCDSEKEILLDAEFADSILTVDISDPGEGFDVSTPYRIDESLNICASGRFFMDNFSDLVEYFRRDGFHVCRLMKKL